MKKILQIFIVFHTVSCSYNQNSNMNDDPYREKSNKSLYQYKNTNLYSKWDKPKRGTIHILDTIEEEQKVKSNKRIKRLRASIYREFSRSLPGIIDNLSDNFSDTFAIVDEVLDLYSFFHPSLKEEITKQNEIYIKTPFFHEKAPIFLKLYKHKKVNQKQKAYRLDNFVFIKQESDDEKDKDKTTLKRLPTNFTDQEDLELKEFVQVENHKIKNCIDEIIKKPTIETVKKFIQSDEFLTYSTEVKWHKIEIWESKYRYYNLKHLDFRRKDKEITDNLKLGKEVQDTIINDLSIKIPIYMSKEKFQLLLNNYDRTTINNSDIYAIYDYEKEQKGLQLKYLVFFRDFLEYPQFDLGIVFSTNNTKETFEIDSYCQTNIFATRAAILDPTRKIHFKKNNQELHIGNPNEEINKIKSLTIERSKLKEEIEVIKKRKKQLHKEKNRNVKKIGELKKENQDLLGDNKQLTDEIERLKKIIEQNKYSTQDPTINQSPYPTNPNYTQTQNSLHY